MMAFSPSSFASRMILIDVVTSSIGTRPTP